jgi:hypothetical protein
MLTRSGAWFRRSALGLTRWVEGFQRAARRSGEMPLSNWAR